jgi:Skp family chaperone for outer membrane proteins
MSRKRKIISGGVGLFAVFLTFLAISAQDAFKPIAVPAGEPAKIALVDVNNIFKQNSAFKEAMESLKTEADGLDKKMREGQIVMAMSQNDLKNLTPGSSEYAEMEEKIARLKTDLTLEAQTKRREMLIRQAKIYGQTYSEIAGEIAKCSAERKIDMVLRFMGDPVDSNNPDSILQEINKPVVYYDHKLDITPDILKTLAEKQK